MEAVDGEGLGWPLVVGPDRCATGVNAEDPQTLDVSLTDNGISRRRASR